jgi:hypothetical protein
MTDPNGESTREFASSFKRFIDAMNAEAAKETSPLLDRLRTHLGGEPGRIPIITEDFDSYEHPNVQVALDKVLFSMAAPPSSSASRRRTSVSGSSRSRTCSR